MIVFVAYVNTTLIMGLMDAQMSVQDMKWMTASNSVRESKQSGLMLTM